MGGSATEAKHSTELLSNSSETSTPSFTLMYDSIAACAIDLGDSVVVTGGGAETHRKVTRYNGGGFVEDLPDLNTARQAHACAYFVNAENEMVYLVAGGKWSKAGGGGDESLSSTELLTAGSAAWVEAAPLPSARNGLRAVTVPLSDYYGADRVLVTGGTAYDSEAGAHQQPRLDSVLEFDQSSYEWRQVGVLQLARGAHAASIVRVQDIQ